MREVVLNLWQMFWNLVPLSCFRISLVEPVGCLYRNSFVSDLHLNSIFPKLPNCIGIRAL